MRWSQPDVKIEGQGSDRAGCFPFPSVANLTTISKAEIIQRDTLKTKKWTFLSINEREYRIFFFKFSFLK